MSTLRLDAEERVHLNETLAAMEAQLGKDYTFVPEMSEFSCKCSGPGQSCIWH